ncbi:hypothetical protein DVW87_06940 [Sphingomonas aracearum]|uniref:DUF2946 domain-containing protein n=1 Tax=Sphingomonas aracearum TaxID=2283317 RepID=A0A369VZ00_9SPHN|nr:hypothetical protein DVW87_06940 [Sphingomonas aracearum]
MAVWLLLLTLFMKVVVPSGYMVGAAGGAFSIELCPGYEPQKPMAMPGGEHHPDTPDHGKAEMPCAFAGLTAPSLAGADPLLLAAAIVFIVRTVFRTASDREPGRRRLHLRPPLRGPPRIA